MNDSRKEDRLPVALVVRYREPTMLEAREGQCQNVSQSGMCILTPKPSPRGALLRFECVSIEGIRGTGRVVWQRGQDDARGPSGMGVRFVRLEAGCAEALEDLIDQLERERQPSSRPAGRAGNGSPAGAPESGARETTPQSGRASTPTPTGITQQGLGAARSRSSHHPTLRGIPTSPLPPGQAVDAPEAGRSPVDDAEARAPHQRSPRPANLAATLPGHATLGNMPFGPSQSAPPPEPAAEGSPGSSRRPSGSRRERLDRTRRGMPPPHSPVPEPGGEGNAAGADPGAGRTTEPGTGGPDPEPAVHATSNSTAAGASDGHAPAEAFAESVGEEAFAARRRALRAAEISSMAPALPDADAPRRRNWVPWVVIGSGLLVSALIVRLFGTMPPSILDKREPSPKAEPPAATASAAEKGGEPGTSEASTEAAPRYVLEITSDPPGARVTAAGQWVLAPGMLELQRLTVPIEVRAEFAGGEVATALVKPEEFELEQGKLVRTLELKRPSKNSAKPRAEEAAKARRSPSEASTERAAAAPERAKADDKPEREAPRKSESGDGRKSKAEERKKESREGASAERAESERRRAEPAAREAPASSSTEEARLPMIAPPPVPIAAAAAESSPAPAAEPQPAAESGARASTEPAEASASAHSPLAVALDCLSRADNVCVIAALQNRAKTERELALLIETYRAVGNTRDAERYIRRYLDAYPNGKNAARYERLLERSAD